MAETEVVDGSLIPADPTALPRPRHRGRFLRFMGLLFIASALALVGYLWWNVWGTGYAARAAQNDLRPAFERNVASLQPTAAPERVVSVPGKAIAIIRIPKIEVDLVVVEGTDTEQLKKGPGHYTWTTYPWDDTGRVGIAGHRTTYGAPFWSLNELRKGDLIRPRDGVRDLQLPRYPHGHHSTIGHPSVGRLHPGSDEESDARAHDLQPEVPASGRLVVIADRVE